MTIIKLSPSVFKNSLKPKTKAKYQLWFRKDFILSGNTKIVEAQG